MQLVLTWLCPGLVPGMQTMLERIVIGKKTREIVKGRCPELALLGVIAAGKTTAYAPYEIFRDELPGGHVIATISGEGEFRIDGKWVASSEGSVHLIPPGVGEHFRAVKGKPWYFCWLHTEPRFFEVFHSRKSCALQADVTLFRYAVEGFIHSAYSEDYAATASPWAGLIRYHAQRFMRAGTADLRLEKVWAAVANEPGKPWDTDSIAKLAGMSREQLRVYSRRETGRSPIQQVSHIRLQRGIEILQTCSYKQQVVAELVGYENAFAFSNALFKATGKRPSAFRSHE